MTQERNVLEVHFANPQIAELRDRNLTLVYHLHGSSEAQEKVVLLMGLFTTKEAWLPILDSFAQKAPDQYQILTLDNRGIGGSDAPKGRYTTSMLADDTMALMDFLHWEHAHIAGISMGGMIAQELASKYPERIDSLALIVSMSSNLSFAKSSLFQLSGIASLISGIGKKEAKSRVENLLYLLYPDEYLNANREKLMNMHLKRVSKIRKPQSPGLFGQFSAVCCHHVGHRRLRAIRDYGFPILIISAEKDRLIHTANSKRLYLALKSDHTKCVRYKDAGHGVIMQHQDEIVDNLVENFARAKPRAVSTQNVVVAVEHKPFPSRSNL